MKTNEFKGGLGVAAWCRQMGCARTFFYSLLKTENAPKTVLLGRRRFVRETPDEYLGRIAALQDGGAK